MKKNTLILIFTCIVTFTHAQDWDGISVPASAGEGHYWELQSEPSDDFNYEFEAADEQTNFGGGKWYNFYHNGWDGPGTTYWQHDHVAVDGNDLVIRASRNTSTTKMGVPGVNAACITSNHRVQYPVFVEASISVANITLASDVWLLSPDDTQEIDIIECYGGAENGNAFFAEFIHLSHHSFIRNPFTDYQPRDQNSWWKRSGVTSWGQYCWNDGDRKYVRVGVNWISPVHFEYYVDGELVRVLYDKAFASKIGNTWSYTYPTMTDGELDFENGWQKATPYATSDEYSFATLQSASEVSTTSVIDPYDFQNGEGFSKELDIIINVESQDWHVDAGRTPTDEELADPTRNTMKVDWLRVYKPVKGQIAVSEVSITPNTISTGVNQSRLLAAEVLPWDASDKSLTWSSDNEQVATVDQEGWITGVSEGSTVIYATSHHGNDGSEVVGSTTVTVQSGQVDVPVDEVTVLPTTVSLQVGQTEQLAATILPVDATDQEVTWSSDDETVAAVDNQGLVTAIGEGQTTIQAMADGLTMPVTVTVTLDPIVWVDADQVRSTTYIVGDEINIECTYNAGASTVNSEGVKFWFREITDSWTVVNDVIAFDESAAGQISGTASAKLSTAGLTPTADLPEGNFYFMFISFNDATGAFKEAPGLFPINLAAPEVSSVTVTPEEATLEIGETLNLQATINPAAASQNVTWSSDATEVASVDAEGIVTAIGAGTATITVTSESGTQSAETVITVNELPLSTKAGKLSTLTVYPNPASSIVNFEGLSGTARVQVINMMGQVIQNAFVSQGKPHLKVANLESGMYLLKTLSDEGAKVIRFGVR